MTWNSHTRNKDDHSSAWERDLIHELALASLKEQRRVRRWGIFFKLAVLVYLLLLLALYLPADIHVTRSAKDHTALIDVRGMIVEGNDASAERVISGLQAAFEDENTKGVLLRINSPGGSPVQAAHIFDEIVRLRGKYPNIPLYAVIMDICASGGYYVAAAADRIYANESSMVGSIGVLINGFGFVDAMKKIGVERRLQIAGKHKGLLDPFSPEKPEEVSHLQSMLDEIHQQFIRMVKKGRGDRLRGRDYELFSGLVWSGKKAVRLGLVDEIGSSGYVAREIIGANEIVDFTKERDYLKDFAERLGTAAGMAMGKALSLQLGLESLHPR
uniref:Protease-4 n=1 Tax=Candidatus Kentrum sp. TC TaxID=2126339 RepID=A0A450Z4W0_9GAMM|nr:MAG: protease-4 [Candidatus Kentron sp. TC]VFK52246.1 MAG: protease-4 [Candidatus Kentron sp. TC]VFK64691.1 MAG: protease-4 [Candidatus Kentron sp. TC]